MATEEQVPRTGRLQFNYIKGPSYREVSCHGVIGGTTPQNLIWMAVYNERPPIPRIVEYEVTVKEGGVTEFEESSAVPKSIESRHGVVRQIDTTIYINLEAAKRLHDWLGRRIDDLANKLNQQ